jgi:hypothetical protein
MSSPVTTTSSTPGTPGTPGDHVWESFLAGNKDNEENILSRSDKEHVLFSWVLTTLSWSS